MRRSFSEHRQLQLCLVGVRIFLDVDDLKDIGALEQYIETSAGVLIFLSRGYFYSRNCLREARKAVVLGRPLVLVHEADPSKGGLPLNELRLQCPADGNPSLSASIFNGRRVIRCVPCHLLRNGCSAALSCCLRHVVGATLCVAGWA